MLVFFLHIMEAQLNNSISTVFISIPLINLPKDEKYYQYVLLI